MKKARQIEIPKDRPLTYKEYEDYSEHAYNSSIWYIERYFCSSGQVKDRLYKKGYSRDTINFVKNDKSGVDSTNIVEDTIFKLQEQKYLNDEYYAEKTLNQKISEGKGLNFIRGFLYQKKVDSEIINKIIENFNDEDSIIEAIDKVSESFIKTSTYKKQENDFLKTQKLTQKLISRGFSFDDISLWRDSKEEL